MHKENTRFTLGKPTWGETPSTFSLDKLFVQQEIHLMSLINYEIKQTNKAMVKLGQTSL